jgi:23S rRNA pseudouridine1911/1915/1917 synthase
MKLSEKDILYEDNHLIAVNKPACVLSQGDSSGDISVFQMVKDYIRDKYNKPGEIYLGLLHRLDRPVSGVILFGKTSKATSRMNKAFQDRKVTKVYHAITESIPEEHDRVLTHWLLKDASTNKSKAFNHEVKRSKKAELKYSLMGHLGKSSLLEIHPKTGRHHQIRCQLAKIQSHIKGDVKYGANRANKDKSICLHSWSLSFEHPVKKEPLTIKAPYPKTQVWEIF